MPSPNLFFGCRRRRRKQPWHSRRRRRRSRVMIFFLTCRWQYNTQLPLAEQRTRRIPFLYRWQRESPFSSLRSDTTTFSNDKIAQEFDRRDEGWTEMKASAYFALRGGKAGSDQRRSYTVDASPCAAALRCSSPSLTDRQTDGRGLLPVTRHDLLFSLFSSSQRNSQLHMHGAYVYSYSFYSH